MQRAAAENDGPFLFPRYCSASKCKADYADSFVVPFGTERQLDRVMKEAFKRVTNQSQVKAKYNQNLTEAQLYAGRVVDRDWYFHMISAVTEPEMAKGHQLRMERHIFANKTLTEWWFL